MTQVWNLKRPNPILIVLVAISKDFIMYEKLGHPNRIKRKGMIHPLEQEQRPVVLAKYRKLPLPPDSQDCQSFPIEARFKPRSESQPTSQ